jgi:hypothetical protein
MKSFPVMLVAVAMLTLAGCKSGPPSPVLKPLNISVEPGGQAANLTIRVYIGPANQLYDKSFIEDPVDQVLKRVAETSTDVKSFQLTSATVKISKKDPIWRVWRDQKRADTLVVVADLPKNFGGADPERRRVIIPLNKRLWNNLRDDTVHVQVRENEVKLLDNPGV